MQNMPAFSEHPDLQKSRLPEVCSVVRRLNKLHQLHLATLNISGIPPDGRICAEIGSTGIFMYSYNNNIYNIICVVHVDKIIIRIIICL